VFPHVFHPSGVGVLRQRLRRSSSYLIYCLREGACDSSIVVLLHEARCSSSNCSLDSSIQSDIRLYQRVARRINVTHLQVVCITHVIGRFIRSIGSGGASRKIGPNYPYHLGIRLLGCSRRVSRIDSLICGVFFPKQFSDQKLKFSDWIVC
jgi:hypothetical protein